VPPATKGAPSNPPPLFRPAASLLHSVRAPASLHFPTEPLHAILRSPKPLCPQKFDPPPPPWPNRDELPSPIALISNPVFLTSPSTSPCYRTHIRALKIARASLRLRTPHHSPLCPLHRCTAPVASSLPHFGAQRLALPLITLSHGPCRPACRRRAAPATPSRRSRVW
jgi:hypothetical protein